MDDGQFERLLAEIAAGRAHTDECFAASRRHTDEVADRLVARPGTRDYGVLTVMLSVHARISRRLELPPGAFTPAPQVRSTLVHLEFTDPLVRIPDERLFEKLVKAIFSQRRKTLLNSLKAFDRSAPLVISAMRLDGRRRPETLEIAEIARIAELIAATRRDRRD